MRLRADKQLGRLLGSLATGLPRCLSEGGRLSSRLSQFSKQSVQEFKNEVELVAKSQHKNLVRLLGFALEREETILVYAYMPSGSSLQSGQLDWSRGHKIMVASNMLLDDDMNPKILDFWIARIFGAKHTQESANRIVGTYGYMSPEYAKHGQFSIKSDLFSFGVLLLEIITGMKTQCSYVSNHDAGLLDYGLGTLQNGAPLEIVDPTMSESFPANEVIGCIHIGLLCIQNDNKTRPAMDTVVLMLSSADSISLPVPKQPTSFVPAVKHKQQSRNLNWNRFTEKLNSSKIMLQCSVNSGYLTDASPR
ncbi:hypothetical protein EUGRSUZ_D00821 [Eucalyptus grandis]|uniref:Protein kinase domain-containing protein n=2 Tax=Eucalyptus grandis TaxID=71139 RepID=A0A059CDD4_EUCGR|nr:hypothetical protein EUGRSUZ_D00821 [Eucalyptus grandis]